MPKSLTLSLIVSAMLSLTSACAPAPATSDFCAIQPDVTPDPGFETRWTRGEKAQIEKLDEHLDDFCRRSGLRAGGF